MAERLQRVNGDTVLEITEPMAAKTRLSENALLRQKAYFETAIAKFQAGLDDVNAKLAMIYAAKDKA